MKQNAPYYIKNLEILNDRIFRYSRILRRIYTFHIQCIIKVEDLNALYLENWQKKVRGLERHPDIYPFLSIS
jgi:hypothetical protein